MLSPCFRHEEMQAHHSCSEKSPLAACPSKNLLQAVPSLLQELHHSFLHTFLTFSVCTLSLALCKWYNQTISHATSWSSTASTLFFSLQIHAFSGTLPADLNQTNTYTSVDIYLCVHVCVWWLGDLFLLMIPLCCNLFSENLSFV